MQRFARLFKDHALGVAVVVIWLVVLSQLMRRHVLAPGPFPGSALSAFSETVPIDGAEEEWMGVYYQGAKIGYSRSTLSPHGDGYHVRERSFLKITAQGFPLTVFMDLRASTGPDFSLESFDFELQAALVNTRITGEVDGRRLQLELETAGKRSSQTLTLEAAPTLPGALYWILRNRTLVPGQAFSFTGFDPVTLRSRETTVRVEERAVLEIRDRDVPCFRVSTEYAGIRMDLWVDETGRVLKQTTPAGWVMLLESRQEALTAGWPSGAGIDMVRATSVGAAGRKITRPSRVRFMSVLLPLDSGEGLDLDGGRQVYEPGGIRPLHITRETLDEAGALALPITDPAMAPYLESTLLVQADHPEVVRYARAIAGGETNSLRAARRILTWLHENVEQRAVPSLPNALEVLHHKAGDCNEFTVLYVALARALGLPARANAGLVYQDGRFYYHAWPEVFTGRWVALDPVFGQLPADATHVRIVTGGIEQQAEIARLIGRLKEIQILDVQYD